MMRVQRFQTLKDILAKAKSGQLAGDLGSRAAEVCHYLSELVSLSKQAPERFWQFLDFWATPFCISRLAYTDAVHDEGHRDHIINNLSAILLLERLQNGGPADAPATYVTRADEFARVAGLARLSWVKFQDESFAGRAVEWRCSPGAASVWLEGKDEAEFTLPIPAQSNRFVEVIPFANPMAGRFPILGEPVLFGKPVNRFMGAYENTGRIEASPLPLEESLAQAQDTLGEVWPEALEWRDLFIPAFVDLGVPPNRMRLSTSYETGSPVFLGRVDDPFFHAEDLVHEIQHHRLFLFADPRNFKSWRDERQNYISAYRHDPRPLRGLIAGLHAFLTVNELRRKAMERQQGREGLRAQMTVLHYENMFTFRSVVEHEEFGEVGRALFEQMAGTLAEHHSLVTTWTTPEAERVTDARIAGHVALVQGEAVKLNVEMKNASPAYRNWGETARIAARFSSPYTLEEARPVQESGPVGASPPCPT
jgi:hypothetical protein